MNEIINDLLNGQTPFARARRHRSGRACTGQAGAGSACSGCTRSGQDGTGSSGCTWTENMRTESAWAGLTSMGLYPNTETCVDLRTQLQEQGAMELGEMLHGMTIRDGEDHFTFTEDTAERRKAERRNPSIYEGRRVNVKRRTDGTVYPTFKRTKDIKPEELGAYDQRALCEVLMVVGQHEAALALTAIGGFDLSEVFASDEGLGSYEEDFGGCEKFGGCEGLGEEEDCAEE